MTWLSEGLYPGWKQSFHVVRELARERSAFQDIVVVETVDHGRVLLLDGVVQITEADEYAYQEMIAHVPLIQHGSAEQVLIIGAGDGGVLRRVLQHRGVQRATMVEIDEAVIRVSKAFLPHIGLDAWTDRRADVIVGDGITYLAAAPTASIDVIIVDSTDPAGPGQVLFTEEFYRDCARVLKGGGLLVNQCGVPFMQPAELRGDDGPPPPRLRARLGLRRSRPDLRGWFYGARYRVPVPFGHLGPVQYHCARCDRRDTWDDQLLVSHDPHRIICTPAIHQRAGHRLVRSVRRANTVGGR